MFPEQSFLVALKLSDHYHNEQKVRQFSPKNLEEYEPTFWRQKAQATLKEKLSSQPQTNEAKNVIFFIGDGMGVQTVAATRMYIQSEETELSFEKFPNRGLASVSFLSHLDYFFDKKRFLL